jgi:hypothetical protein
VAQVRNLKTLSLLLRYCQLLQFQDLHRLRVHHELHVQQLQVV